MSRFWVLLILATLEIKPGLRSTLSVAKAWASSMAIRKLVRVSIGLHLLWIYWENLLGNGVDEITGIRHRAKHSTLHFNHLQGGGIIAFVGGAGAVFQ